MYVNLSVIMFHSNTYNTGLFLVSPWLTALLFEKFLQTKYVDSAGGFELRSPKLEVITLTSSWSYKLLMEETKISPKLKNFFLKSEPAQKCETMWLTLSKLNSKTVYYF